MTEPSENTPQTATNQGSATDFPGETEGNFDAAETRAQETELTSKATELTGDVTKSEAVREFTEQEIAAIEAQAVPGVVRKAPRMSVFFWLGSLVGIVAGLIFGFTFTQPHATNRWIEVTVTVAFTTMVTVMIAAALYIYLERRSVKKAHSQG